MSQRRARFGRFAAAVKGASALAVGVGLMIGAGAGVAHAATAPDPLKNWTVAHIEATAIANAEQAPSLTLSGTFSASGQTIAMKIAVKKGLGCAATIEESKLGTEKIIAIGKTVYLYLDKTFWTSVGGANGAATYAKIGGRYMKLSSASLASTESAVCSVQGDLASGTKDKVTRGAVSTLDGVRVLELKDSDGSDIYVTDSSKPEIFAATSPKGSKNGAGTFWAKVGGPVAVAAPPAKDVVNGAEFGF